MLGLKVQSVVSDLPHKGVSRVYIEISKNFTKSILFSLLLAILQVKHSLRSRKSVGPVAGLDFMIKPFHNPIKTVSHDLIEHQLPLYSWPLVSNLAGSI
jgi:hypothetical protein